MATIEDRIPRATATPSAAPGAERERRWLHPMAWWAWAVGLAIAASSTTNPLLLVGLIAAAAVVVERRRPDAPWSRSFAFFVRIAVFVVVIRLLAQILFGAPTGGIRVVELPGIDLPAWFAGVRLGGTVMLEPMLQALYDGLRLAAIIVAVGAAGSLASPARVLKSVPAAVYEVGVSVVVASTFVPQLVTDVARVRTNRRLRGRPDTGVRAVGGTMLPVLHSAMDRSITLAAAMDSRGYGRSADRSRTHRLLTGGALLTGLVLVVIGVFLLLGVAAPTWGAWGLVAVVVGLGFAALSLTLAGRRSVRTRYRPNTWHAPDILTALCGAATAALFIAAARIDPAGMTTTTEPPVWPSLPWLSLVGLAIALAPGWLTPAPPKAAP
jgi:energy-coupling factor transport system permease protein